MSTYHQSFSKRLLDIFFSLLILPVVIPALLICIILVWVTSGTPIFFVQTRVGRNGAHFQLIKLRSLRNKFDSKPGALHGPGDITVIGKIMRKSRLDEIPQIWNILKGEMSWVGPRPDFVFDDTIGGPGEGQWCWWWRWLRSTPIVYSTVIR